MPFKQLRCGCWPSKPGRRSSDKQANSAHSAVDPCSHPSVVDPFSQPSHQVVGWDILDDILEVETNCFRQSCELQHRQRSTELTSRTQKVCSLQAECLLDDPHLKYFLCNSPGSQDIMSYLWVQLDGVSLDSVVSAFVCPEEQVERDPESEYRVIHAAKANDPTHQEDIYYVMRAPWPFFDRDVLLHRWQLPLRDGGVAIVMKSFVDDMSCLAREDRVRAHVYKCGYIVRPSLHVKGMELTVCWHADLGGIAPSWAQGWLLRFAVQRLVRWVDDLTEHLKRKSNGSEENSEQRFADSPISTSLSPVQRCGEQIRKTHGSETVSPLLCEGDTLHPHEKAGVQVLEAILHLERCCCPPAQAVETPNGGHTSPSEEQLVVERILDEPDTKYFLCSSLESAVITAYLWSKLPGLTCEEVCAALVQRKDRVLRDPDSEYRVLREAQEGDPTNQEDISYVMFAPWPFWHRDILQRRWQLPLEKKGMAIVMKSFTDDELFPPREDRVRAFVHKSAYLVRRFGEDATNRGVELAVCTQLDLGGLCPQWAQAFLTRFAVQRGVQWVENLNRHCLAMRNTRSIHDPTGKELLQTSPTQEQCQAVQQRQVHLEEVLSQPRPVQSISKAILPQKGVEAAHVVLNSVLSIEKCCLACRDTYACLDVEPQLDVECLIDEPDIRYCLCSSLHSAVAIGYLWAKLQDVGIESVRLALTDEKQRKARDPDSEYQVLTKAHNGDPVCEEEISYVMLAPWPFWDREVLHRRWQLPLNDNGIAIVMKSFDDDMRFPRREDRVRASVLQSAYMIRPSCGSAPGVDITVCQHIDLGGFCPKWAQTFLTRFSARQSQVWAKKLRHHCLEMWEPKNGDHPPNHRFVQTS